LLLVLHLLEISAHSLASGVLVKRSSPANVITSKPCEVVVYGNTIKANAQSVTITYLTQSHLPARIHAVMLVLPRRPIGSVIWIRGMGAAPSSTARWLDAQDHRAEVSISLGKIIV
jgi:hypothetical protein